jgi:hypothetical protein
MFFAVFELMFFFFLFCKGETLFGHVVPGSVQFIEFLSRHFRLVLCCHGYYPKVLPMLDNWNENWKKLFSGFVSQEDFVDYFDGGYLGKRVQKSYLFLFATNLKK